MKNLFIVVFLLIMSKSFSQPIYDNWTAIKDFHEVLSKTFHPIEEGNLEPIKVRSEELMNKASDLLKLDIPEEYRTNTILSSIEKLQIECKKLHLLVSTKASDIEITKSITYVHTLFYQTVGLCNDEKK